MTRLVIGSLLFALSALVTAGPASAQATASATGQAPANGAAPDSYKIGPEDMLHIVVWKNDVMTRLVPVRPDGKISLPLLNDVQAAGLTALELRDVLAKRLAEYMPSPEVAVIVAEVRSFKVSVMGEVTRPGRYELKSWATVLDALALAGGFTQFATRSRIVVLRQDNGTTRRILFNYNKVAGEQENFYLNNGDILLVP
jgi:polysaccharide biosynthesis/export protein